MIKQNRDFSLNRLRRSTQNKLVYLLHLSWFLWPPNTGGVPCVCNEELKCSREELGTGRRLTGGGAQGHNKRSRSFLWGVWGSLQSWKPRTGRQQDAHPYRELAHVGEHPEVQRPIRKLAFMSGKSRSKSDMRWWE